MNCRTWCQRFQNNKRQSTRRSNQKWFHLTGKGRVLAACRATKFELKPPCGWIETRYYIHTEVSYSNPWRSLSPWVLRIPRNDVLDIGTNVWQSIVCIRCGGLYPILPGVSRYVIKLTAIKQLNSSHRLKSWKLIEIQHLSVRIM